MNVFDDTFLIVTASMGTAVAVVVAAVGPICAILVGPVIKIAGLAGGFLDKVGCYVINSPPPPVVPLLYTVSSKSIILVYWSEFMWPLLRV